MLSSYVSELDADGFQHILILTMSYLLKFYFTFLNSGIGRGLIRVCTSALRQTGVKFFIILYRDVLGGL